MEKQVGRGRILRLEYLIAVTEDNCLKSKYEEELKSISEQLKTSSTAYYNYDFNYDEDLTCERYDNMYHSQSALKSMLKISDREELNVLILDEGLLYAGDKYNRKLITLTKDRLKFMLKLNKLIPVTTTVDVYRYIFKEDKIHKNKYDILKSLIDKDDVFKVDKYTKLKDAKRESLKTKYKFESLTTIEGQSINYKDDALIEYEVENCWITETVARLVIKKFEEMM